MIQVVQQSNRPSSTLGFCFHCKASSVQPGKLASGGKWWQVVASGSKWWQVVASVTGFSTTRKAATFRSACSGATKLFFPSATAQEPSHVGAIVVNNNSTSRNTENAMCSKTVPLVPLYLRVSNHGLMSVEYSAPSQTALDGCFACLEVTPTANSQCPRIRGSDSGPQQREKLGELKMTWPCTAES